MTTHTDHAVRLPEDLAINILNAAATFSFDMIEAVDGYYRRHLMMAVEQGNVSRQKEILNELLRALSNHAGSRHGQAVRDRDVIEQIRAIEEGLVSGDPTEWTFERAVASPKPKVDITEVLKAGKEKMLEDVLKTQAHTPSELMDDPDFDLDEKPDSQVIPLLTKYNELNAEKKAAGDIRKAIARLQEILAQKDSQYDFYPLTNDLMGALYYHIKGLKEQIDSIECDLFEDIDL